MFSVIDRGKNNEWCFVYNGFDTKAEAICFAINYVSLSFVSKLTDWTGEAIEFMPGMILEVKESD